VDTSTLLNTNCMCCRAFAQLIMYYPFGTSVAPEDVECMLQSRWTIDHWCGASFQGVETIQQVYSRNSSSAVQCHRSCTALYSISRIKGMITSIPGNAKCSDASLHHHSYRVGHNWLSGHKEANQRHLQKIEIVLSQRDKKSSEPRVKNKEEIDWLIIEYFKVLVLLYSFHFDVLLLNIIYFYDATNFQLRPSDPGRANYHEL
jgi:hypothetical protein